MMVAAGDDGGDGRLRPRARRRGHGDERGNAASDLQKARELRKRPVRPRETRRGGLGRVHRRTAADDEEAVAAINLVLRDDLFDRLGRRVRLDRGEDGEKDILFIEFFLQGAEVLVRALTAARDDERAAQAVFAQNVRGAQQAPLARKDLRRAPGEKARADGKAALERAAEKRVHRTSPLPKNTNSVYHGKARKKRTERMLSPSVCVFTAYSSSSSVSMMP